MHDGEKAAALHALTNVEAQEYPLRAKELFDAANAAGASGDEISSALRARAELPRLLTDREAAAARLTIEMSASEDREALLAQLSSAQVVGYCGCGCATVHLEVPPSQAPRAGVTREVIDTVFVLDTDGEIEGGIIVFTADGYLDSLEVHDFGGEPISPMPPIERLTSKSPFKDGE